MRKLFNKFFRQKEGSEKLASEAQLLAVRRKNQALKEIQNLTQRLQKKGFNPQKLKELQLDEISYFTDDPDIAELYKNHCILHEKRYFEVGNDQNIEHLEAQSREVRSGIITEIKPVDDIEHKQKEIFYGYVRSLVLHNRCKIIFVVRNPTKIHSEIGRQFRPIMLKRT